MNTENLYEQVSEILGAPLPNTSADAIVIAAAILHVGNIFRDAMDDDGDVHFNLWSDSLMRLADKFAPRGE